MIDIWKRNCPCCGEPTKTIFLIDIGTKRVEICFSCVQNLRDQLSVAIDKEMEPIKVQFRETK